MALNYSSDKIPQLVMLRPHLDDIPQAAPAEGYGIRSSQPGDGPAWEEIIRASFQTDMSYAKMDQDPAYRPERVWFALDGEGHPVATAACWQSADTPADCAVLHMVGTRPDCSGKGLGAAVVAAAMEEAAREGFSRMRLRTDPHRIPAIKIYLRMGFLPYPIHAEHLYLWTEVLVRLKRTDLLPVYLCPEQLT